MTLGVALSQRISKFSAKSYVGLCDSSDELPSTQRLVTPVHCGEAQPRKFFFFFLVSLGYEIFVCAYYCDNFGDCGKYVNYLIFLLINAKTCNCLPMQQQNNGEN